MPIKGKLKEGLTMDAVLSKVSEFDIYRHFVGNFDLNGVICNPFRKDNNPSFIIGNKYGHLSHYDFADPLWRGDCFSLVKQIYNLSSLNETLERIDAEMGLGFRGVQKDYKKAISQYEQPEVTKRNTLIQVVTRKFTQEELKYWNDYYQDITDLRNNNVYSIKTLFLNKKKFPLKDTELRFGYFYDGYWKLYKPFASKRDKWLSNVPLSMSWGEENLNKDHNSLVAKSKKDYLVCRKIYEYTCGVQNESLAAFSEEFVNRVKSNSKDVFYGGDSDAPGKKASYQITQAFRFRHINPEDRLLPECNDFACWAKTEGLKKVEEHFKLKGLK